MASESEDDLALVARLGEDAIHRLAAAFYRRIPADDVLGPMYPRGQLEAAEARLAGFLVYRFGGSPRYVEERGHPRLRMRHAPFHVDQKARDRWMQHMTDAIDECCIPPSDAAVLRGFFGDVATFLINRS